MYTMLRAGTKAQLQVAAQQDSKRESHSFCRSSMIEAED